MPASEIGSTFRVVPGHQAVFRELAIDSERVFGHPRIQPWRTLPDRENCTLVADLAGGRHIFWHIKRYAAVPGKTPVEKEVAGITLLENAGIATVSVVGYGKLEDSRSFLILENLDGYTAGDRWIEQGRTINPFIDAVADLAARLHRAGLHHRDLYFCHFMLRSDPLDVRLIDAARVQRLGRGPSRLRWIVKDLAQLWYSLPADSPRQQIMDRYLRAMGWTGVRGKIVQAWVHAKARAIGRHDMRLRRKQPKRNISLPESV